MSSLARCLRVGDGMRRNGRLTRGGENGHE